MINRILIMAAFIAAAVGGVALAAPAGGSTGSASQKCQAAQASPASRHVVDNGMSLDRWARVHQTYVGNVLGMTYSCEDGWQQLSLLNYLDKGYLHSPLPKGTVLWAFPYTP